MTGKWLLTLAVTRNSEGGTNNFFVRSVENTPKLCKIGHRQSNLPQIVHIFQNRTTAKPNVHTKPINVPPERNVQKEHTSYTENKKYLAHTQKKTHCRLQIDSD